MIESSYANNLFLGIVLLILCYLGYSSYKDFRRNKKIKDKILSKPAEPRRKLFLQEQQVKDEIKRFQEEYRKRYDYIQDCYYR